MKRLIFALLSLTAVAFAQGGRYDHVSDTVISRYVMVIPNATIAICAHPGNAAPCTNYATTYTDITLVHKCNSNAQIVQQGVTSCTSKSDAQGNFGVWVPPGTYDYTMTIGGTAYGPYAFTVGGGGGTNIGPGNSGSIAILTPTSGDSGAVQFKIALSTTLVRLSCSTDVGTASINLEIRTETAPNTTGTSVLASPLNCGTTTVVTTGFSVAAIPAYAPVALIVTGVSGSPGVVRVHYQVQ